MTWTQGKCSAPDGDMLDRHQHMRATVRTVAAKAAKGAKNSAQNVRRAEQRITTG